jgi:hypothetical protein
MKSMGLDFDLIENDSPMNLEFSQNGFESKQFLKNIGATLLFVILYLAAWFLLLLTKRISSVWPQYFRVKTSLEKILIWE